LPAFLAAAARLSSWFPTATASVFLPLVEFKSLFKIGSRAACGSGDAVKVDVIGVFRKLQRFFLPFHRYLTGKVLLDRRCEKIDNQSTG